jgi:CheY-like chemotaxis protein
VSTELGKGSQFRVGVPLVEVASFKPPKTEAVDSVTDVPSGKKVLVVEDSKDNQMLVKLILDRQGMRVDFANNGSEGYKRAIAGQYDLVLMDMQMPVMDGYQATNELRSNGYTKPIIALTAHAMKEDRERCLQAGCSDYLTKPIDSNVLYGTLARHLDAVQA